MTENRLEIPDESSLQVSSTIRKIEVSLMEMKPQAYPARDAAVLTAPVRPPPRGPRRWPSRSTPAAAISLATNGAIIVLYLIRVKHIIPNAYLSTILPLF